MREATPKKKREKITVLEHRHQNEKVDEVFVLMTKAVNVPIYSYFLFSLLSFCLGRLPHITSSLLKTPVYKTVTQGDALKTRTTTRQRRTQSYVTNI